MTKAAQDAKADANELVRKHMITAMDEVGRRCSSPVDKAAVNA